MWNQSRKWQVQLVVVVFVVLQMELRQIVGREYPMVFFLLI